MSTRKLLAAVAGWAAVWAVVWTATAGCEPKIEGPPPVVMEILRNLTELAVKQQAATRQSYDLVIRNARVVDGTGNPWFYADVAVRGERIAAVARPGSIPAGASTRSVDAGGKVLCPGFIDVHTHADEGLLRRPSADNFVRNGVTTIVTGNCGYGPRDIGGYLRSVGERRTAVNVGVLVGHNSVLRAVGREGAGKLSAEQLAAAKALVRKGMEEGAVGFSTGLIYTPGKYSDTEEIIELARVAGESGGIYATHMRSESGEILEAIDEALRIGREAGCRVEISHFKLPTDAAARLGGSDATLAKVVAARAAGQEVWLDQYPYTASSTSVSAMLPDWVMEKGAEEGKRLLKTEEGRAKCFADLRALYTKRGKKDLSHVVIASFDAEPSLNGRNLKQIAQTWKIRALQANGAAPELLKENAAAPEVTLEDQFAVVVDLVLRGGASAVFHSFDEKEVENILRNPLVSVASDSGVRTLGEGIPHPRGYGTNTRVLGRYVRERKVIGLEEAVRKMTSMPATAFRLADRGVIRVGAYADLVLFDPATVEDKATFEDPHRYPVGIDLVMVNGAVVVNADGQTGSLNGRAILGPTGKAATRPTLPSSP